MGLGGTVIETALESRTNGQVEDRRSFVGAFSTATSVTYIVRNPVETASYLNELNRCIMLQ